MKRNLVITCAALAATATLFSCQKEAEIIEKTEPATEKASAIMTVNAGEIQTKTFLEADGDNYNVKWSAGDRIAAFEVGNGVVATSKTPSSELAADAASASFTMDFSGNTSLSANYSYLFVYPAGALTQSSEIYRGRIKWDQTFSATSFDKDADLMISEAVSDQATRPTSVNVGFARVGATVLMNLKAPSTSETIQSIEFSTTQGNIAGYVKVYPLTGTYDTDIYSGRNTITLTPASATTYTGTIPVWFRCAAIDLNTDFTVTVHTTGKSYTKTVDLAAASKTIKFENAAMTKFNVDMTSAAAYTHFAVGTEITSIFPATKAGVKFSNAQGTGSTAPFYASPYNWYKNSTVTISGGTTGYISKVVFNYESGELAAENFESDDDDATYALADKVGTWNVGADPVNSVTFTNKTNKATFSSIDVFFTGTPNATVETSNPTLAFASATAEVAMGGSLTVTATTNYNNGTITYSSLNTNIATVNSTTGAITPVAEGGPVTIRATLAGATTAYSIINEQTADIAVTVTTPATWDVINYALTGLGKNTASYMSWNNKAGSYSSAVYAGNSNRINNDSPYIQIRNGSGSGIISTTSGGALKRVRINSWNAAGTNANTLTIYGKNAPYTSTSELYSTDPYVRGTSLGTIAAGSTDWLSISNSYEYIGIISTSGAKYFNELDVEWQALKTRVDGATGFTATVDGTTINVNWTNAASGVAGYIVTCTGQTSKYISDGSHTASFTELDNGDYTITIQSVPTDPSSNAYSTVQSTAAKVTAAVVEVWQETALASIGASDIFVIVGTKSGNTYVLSNDCTGSAAPATSITIADGKVSGTVQDKWKWNVTTSAGKYKFYPNGVTTTWLTFADTNNGVRVGNTEVGEFTYSDSKLSATTGTNTRYLSVYNTQDWRCYTSGSSNVTVKFYVLQP